MFMLGAKFNRCRHPGFTAIGNKLYFVAEAPEFARRLRWIDTSLTTPVLNTIQFGRRTMVSSAVA